MAWFVQRVVSNSEDRGGSSRGGCYCGGKAASMMTMMALTMEQVAGTQEPRPLLFDSQDYLDARSHVDATPGQGTFAPGYARILSAIRSR